MTALWLRLIARLVPAGRREAWLAEWRAEHWVLLREHAETTTGRGRLRFVIGAIPHALAVRRAGSIPRYERSSTMTSLLSDIRFALRAFRRAPAFSLLATATLAIGIGSTTAVFSVFDGVLLRSMPYPAAERLVMLGSVSLRFPGLSPESPLNFLDWREQNGTFQDLIAADGATFDLIGGDAPERVNGASVAAGYFEMLGVAPAIGRTFAAADDIVGSEPVVVVSHGFWQRRLGAASDAIGSRIATATATFTVVGV